MNDWAPQACCDMISRGIKYIAGICFPPLSGSDDTADKYTSSKVEEPRQQNKYVLCSIILIASSCLLGVGARNGRLLSPNSDCFLRAQYGFCTRRVILYYSRDFAQIFTVLLVHLCVHCCQVSVSLTNQKIEMLRGEHWQIIRFSTNVHIGGI